jgi:Ran GTPase-activating protein (RanGAP) involved in mRNA processing and transport
MAHEVRATFNEVSKDKMAELERLELKIEKINETQVVVECSSDQEDEVRSFMAAPVE